MDSEQNATTPQEEQEPACTVADAAEDAGAVGAAEVVATAGTAPKSSSDTASEAATDETQKSTGISRRSFVIGAGTTAVLLGLGATRFLPSTQAVRPPGGQDEDALTSACIRCNRCVEACPQKIIVPSHIEYGLLNMRTPHLEFSKNEPGILDSIAYCDFCANENGGFPRCVKVCPTQALFLESNFDAASIVLGTAEINTDLCMAYRSGKCAFCHDACVQVRGDQNAAIYYSGDDANLLPKVDAQKCNGCGACEAVCVSTQAGSIISGSERAIIVRPVQG